MNAATLLSAALDDVLRPAASLTDVLLKVKALAYVLENEQLKTWTTLELEGYEGQRVPAYRKVGLLPRVHLIHRGTGHELRDEPMRVDYLPEHLQAALTLAHVGNSVAEIEFMARQPTDGTIVLSQLLIDAVAEKAYHQDWHIRRGWQVMPSIQVPGMLAGIRSQLLDFLFALRKLGDELTLTALQPAVRDALDRVLHFMQVTEGGIVNIASGSNAVQATTTGASSSLHASSGAVPPA